MTLPDQTLLYKDNLPFLVEVWQAMRVCLYNASFEQDLDLLPRPEKAAYSIIDDPFDGSRILEGIWRDSTGNKQGEIRLRHDGSVYAELDVIRKHPVDVRWFVESVTAWGSTMNIKTELRLLPSTGE